MLKEFITNGLILAAGMSSRMDEFKPLLPLNGKTLIENTVDSLIDGGADKVLIVIGYRADDIKRLLQNKYNDRIIFATNEEYEKTDMFCSFKIGIKAMPFCNAFFLLPGDMPLVSAGTFKKLSYYRQILKKEQKRVIFPVLKGKRKHPVLMDFDLINDILEFKGGKGLKGFFESNPDIIYDINVDDKGIDIDFDTPSDYKKFKDQ